MSNPELEQGSSTLPVAELYVNFETAGHEVNVTVRGPREPKELLDRAYQAMRAALVE
jgi:hypothetical protein